jgi:hypothetical protein
MSPTVCARSLLEAIRAEKNPAPYRSRLATYNASDLEPVRTHRESALAFWVNCYNATTQLLLTHHPELYESQLRLFRFFGQGALTVGGETLSLDDIEHGILRCSRSKYGLGYIPRIGSGSFERRHQLAVLDVRVHFALNCGAKSCPPIRSYRAEHIDEQLDAATRHYLQTEIERDDETDKIYVPQLFLWYLGDFGGLSGARSLLHRYDIVPTQTDWRLRFQGWDWKQADGKFLASMSEN